MKKLFFLLVIVVMAPYVHAQQKLVQLWESKEQLPVPESVLYMPDRDELFVSLIDGAGNEKDGNGGVAILNLDGSLKNPTWIEGLHAPKGMAVYQDLLYVADLTEVVVIDIISGNIINQIPVEGATFLNDVTIDRSGRVYISDTRQNKIFVINNNRAALYLDNVNDANGLKIINDQLYVLAGKELWRLDNNKRKTIVATGFEQNGDGLEPVGNGDYLVTCWAGLIYYVKADGTIEKLLDVQGKMNTADLGYNPKEKTLYIPTFNNNSVIAYKLQ